MGKEMTTTVVLNGKATAGFNALADKVTQLGYVISQLGGQVGEWEKESLEIYKNYETYMLEAKGAMSATVETSTELEQVYKNLGAKAQEWAGSTIFHTNDVAKAISEAAHAGWDYEKMLQGIPQAIVLAQAGNTDLSTGLDMLIKTLNGTGTAFEDSGTFVDQWVMAANSSATTVSELGEAMEKMGATARFGSSTGELLTMLSVLANTGTVGSAAGTLLRNSMIRLIAPTKNAREAMEGLGVEADEISEAVGSDAEALTEVNNMLEQAGFSAYTTEGRLKPFLTTFQDLYKATSGMTEEQRNKVLSAIFPTRTITGALALLQAAAENYDGLLEKITDSEDYAAKVAKIQTSGLMGSEELFKSKWEEFSRKIGETLSDPVESTYKFLGGVVDTLNGVSPETLAAIAGAATALAAAGPGLITAGLGMKLFSVLGPGGTAMLAGVVAIGALVGYFGELNKLAMENNFGQMALDMGTINEALDGIGEDKAGLLSNLRDFNQQFVEMRDNYDKAGTALAEGLTSKMIAGTTLTDDDKKRFSDYGETMIASLKSGIDTATAQKMSMVSLLFGESNTAEESNEALANNPAYASLISLIEVGMNGAKDRAAELSKDLRSALTSAFADGKLSEAELTNIQSIMNQINELMDGLNPSDVERNKLRLKSQRVSLDSMKDFGDEVKAAEEATFKGMDDQLLDLQATIQTYYDWAVAHGQKFIHPVTGELVDPGTVDIQTLIDATQTQYDTKRQMWASDYREIMMRGWQNALQTSDTGGLFLEAQGLIAKAQSGQLTFDDAKKRITNLVGGNPDLLASSMDQMINFFGGVDEMADLAKTYRTNGQNGLADWLEQMVLMREALGGKKTGVEQTATQPEEQRSNQDMINLLDEIRMGATEDDVVKYYGELNEQNKAAWDTIVAGYKEKYDLAAIARDFDTNGGEGLSAQVLDWFGAYIIGNQYAGKIGYGPNYDLSKYEWANNTQPQQAAQAAAVETTITPTQKVEIQPVMTGEGADSPLKQLQDQGVQVAITPDATELTATIDAEDGQNLVEYISGDATELHYSIMAEDGTMLVSNVTGDTSALERAIREQNGKTITVYVKEEKVGGLKENAFGGRATEPEIFGEAGPEWAIPEQHTQRTADLLKAAASASGFTWGELLATNSGLNAGGGISVNIQSYSPVIHANDATGVAEELSKDKARLGSIVKKAVESAIENMHLHRAIEVYA